MIELLGPRACPILLITEGNRGGLCLQADSSNCIPAGGLTAPAPDHRLNE